MEGDFAKQSDHTIPNSFGLKCVRSPHLRMTPVSRYRMFPSNARLALGNLFDHGDRELARVLDFNHFIGEGEVPLHIRHLLRGNEVWPVELVKKTDEFEDFVISVSRRSTPSNQLVLSVSADRDALMPGEYDDERRHALERSWPGRYAYPFQKEADDKSLTGIYGWPAEGGISHPDLNIFGTELVLWMDQMMNELIYRVFVNRMLMHRLRVEQELLADWHRKRMLTDKCVLLVEHEHQLSSPRRNPDRESSLPLRYRASEETRARGR